MEINKKMDIQVASLKTVLESLKLETVRYLAGDHNIYMCTLINHTVKEEGLGLAESDCCLFPIAALQQRCSLVLPSPWESTVCGGE